MYTESNGNKPLLSFLFYTKSQDFVSENQDNELISIDSYSIIVMSFILKAY